MSLKLIKVGVCGYCSVAMMAIKEAHTAPGVWTLVPHACRQRGNLLTRRDRSLIGTAAAIKRRARG
jgi:hypothetical protein